MGIKLMYITNEPDVALIAEDAGADRIFVDMEFIGKAERQGGMNTVQNRHTPEDVRVMKQTLRKAQVLCRVNPIHEASAEYVSSKEEIDAAIAAGADILMLPYFKTAEEVRTFIDLVDGRAIVLPLVETPEAVACIDEILALKGIDEIFVGLNDLSLGYGMKFMFEPLANGTVEALCRKFAAAGIPYGFGGITHVGRGMLPAENILQEHYRLGSGCVILSRSFCNSRIITDREEIRTIFREGIGGIRALEEELRNCSGESFEENRRKVARIVSEIVGAKC